VAFKPSAAEALPVKQGKTHVKTEEWRRILVRHKGKVVVYRRPDSGIWAGLHDLPTPEDALEWGANPEGPVWQDPVVHLLSHRRLFITFGHWEWTESPTVKSPFQWIEESEWAGQAWPAPLRRWLKKNATFGSIK
jgi:A/G-specific adenine glycosylase